MSSSWSCGLGPIDSGDVIKYGEELFFDERMAACYDLNINGRLADLAHAGEDGVGALGTR